MVRTMRMGRAVWVAASALLLVYGLTLAAVSLAATDVSARYGPGASRAGPVDAVIVLGAGAAWDGRLDPASERRADAAIAMVRRGEARAAIFTGVLRGAPPERSVGTRMAEYALARGLDSRAAIAEPYARTTFENLRLSFAAAEARGFERLAVVSDSYHLTRARALGAYFGRPDLAVVASDTPERSVTRPLAAHAREALAWWYNLAKVAGWEALGLAGIPEAERAEWIW